MYANSLVAYIKAMPVLLAERGAKRGSGGPHWRLGLQRSAAALAAEARAVLARLSGGAVASAPG
jgi:hypothetical protein